MPAALAPPPAPRRARLPTGAASGGAAAVAPGAGPRNLQPSARPRNPPAVVIRRRQQRRRQQGGQRHQRLPRPGARQRSREPRGGPAAPPSRSHRGGSAGRWRKARPNIRRSERSGRQLNATLAAPSREDGPTSAGPHAQPEPVGPRAATVVRLERTLALAHGCRSPGASWLVLLWQFSLQDRSRRDCGSRVIPSRRGRHCCERVSPGSGSVRGRGHARMPAGGRETAVSLGGRYRRRQNQRPPSPSGRHAVTSVVLAYTAWLWQHPRLVSLRRPDRVGGRPAGWHVGDPRSAAIELSTTVDNSVDSHSS
jgi:hypothetical protein